MKTSYVYIMSNKYKTVLYVGVTADLPTRVLQHKSGEGSQFTSQYKLVELMYFEEHSDIRDAIEREKQLKNWHREWKWDLIKKENPELRDLSGEIIED